MSVLKVSTTSFDVGLEGGTLSFDLKCNYDWALENDSDWCVFASSDMSGGDTGPEGRHITFTVKDGWSGGYHGDRQAVITARNLNSGETVRIYVNQEASLYSADYFFNVSAHSLTAPTEGGTVNFTLTCNADWIAKSDSDWCLINASDRSGSPTATSGRTITVTVSGDAEEAGTRTAVIMVKKIETGEALLVEVTQTTEEAKFIPFKVLPTTLTANPDGGMGVDGWTMYFLLWCNGDWTIESDSDWVSPYTDDKSGSTTATGGRRIWLHIEQSPGTETRNAVVTVKKTDTGETLKVSVTQPPETPTFRTDMTCYEASAKTASPHPAFYIWSDGD